MAQVKIRNAVIDDAPALADLSTQLGYPTRALQSANRLDAILGSKEQVVLVACLSDGSVVGWVHVFLTLRIESDPFAEVGGFVVSEQHRGQGIGRSLLEEVEAWVIRHGIKNLRVRSRSTRIDAHAFYQRLGFTKTKNQTVFDKPIQASA
jgi:GNAT superfamily N-acetyltransferase